MSPSFYLNRRLAKLFHVWAVHKFNCVFCPSQPLLGSNLGGISYGGGGRRVVLVVTYFYSNSHDLFLLLQFRIVTLVVM